MEKQNQWPDNICSGQIQYGRASNYDGFYLADASHGIPTIGSVSPDSPPTIRGQHVHVFNYPGQTEEIAKQLVLRWNAHDDLVKALERIGEFSADYDRLDRKTMDAKYPEFRSQMEQVDYHSDAIRLALRDIARAALASAQNRRG